MHVSLGKDAPRTRPIERFGNVALIEDRKEKGPAGARPLLLFWGDGFAEIQKAVDMLPVGKETDEILVIVDAIDDGALDAEGWRLRFAWRRKRGKRRSV